jgi:hypothetical protein
MGLEMKMKREIEDLANSLPIGWRWTADWELKFEAQAALDQLAAHQNTLATPRMAGQVDGGYVTTAGLLMLAGMGTSVVADRIALTGARLVAKFIEAAARSSDPVAPSFAGDAELIAVLERYRNLLGEDHPDYVKYRDRAMKNVLGEPGGIDPTIRYLSVQMYLDQKGFAIDWVVKNRAAFGMALAAMWREAHPGQELRKHTEPLRVNGAWGGVTVIEPYTNRYTESDRSLFDAVLSAWIGSGRVKS